MLIIANKGNLGLLAQQYLPICRNISKIKGGRKGKQPGDGRRRSPQSLGSAIRRLLGVEKRALQAFSMATELRS